MIKGRKKEQTSKEIHHLDDVESNIYFPHY